MPLIHESEDYYVRAGTQKDEYSPDEVVTVPCPLCGSEARQRIYTEHGSIGVVQCQSCSLLYTSPRIKSPEAIYWGDSEQYWRETRWVLEGHAPHHRDPNYKEELALIKRYKPTGRFLDVGCNAGRLLSHAKAMGWDVMGVEPSESLAKIAIEQQGLPVYQCYLNKIPQNEYKAFDIITLSDVLEHISEPIPFLQDAAKYLADDGILYIKVPNARWNLLKQRAMEKMGKHPKQGLWDSYEHVVHYTDETLSKMLAKAGFYVSRIAIGKPVQIPVWHQYVGHYFQHPTPWVLDWKRYLGRSVLYGLSLPEKAVRGGSIGSLAPNIVAIARKRNAR
ncbi:MAG: class I SAM-dependent methyltransferase [Abitibacteriaceae bacterium]|nr:class I SAM-dependent methyltransferase [Abditibacteriaceae bacterium]